MAKTVKSVEGFYYTTAIRKLRGMTSRVRGVPGGTSAGKTYGILPILINEAAKRPGLDISVVSESVPHLRRGALKDFLAIMKATGRYDDEHYNRTLLTYTFENGSYIEFFSADQESKVRGPRRKILYINECNNIEFDTYHQLAIRTSETIWLDFNPSSEFWYHTELKAGEGEDFSELILTYKDNEALSGSIIKEIEKAREKAYYNPDLSPEEGLFDQDNIKNFYWHNWWRVYGLGLVGTLEGVIFEDWDQVDSVPPDARLLGYGMDFGFTNDPTALVAMYKYNDRIYWDEIIYRRGLKNGDIASIMKSNGIAQWSTVIAESAEPKSIAEINEYGFSVQSAEKGKDSVLFGIGILQEQGTMYVTKRSTNIIRELRQYMWAKDSSGKVLNEPVDAFNHAIDAMRYIATKKLSKAFNKKISGIRVRN